MRGEGGLRGSSPYLLILTLILMQEASGSLSPRLINYRTGMHCTNITAAWDSSCLMSLYFRQGNCYSDIINNDNKQVQVRVLQVVNSEAVLLSLFPAELAAYAYTEYVVAGCSAWMSTVTTSPGCKFILTLWLMIASLGSVNTKVTEEIGR